MGERRSYRIGEVARMARLTVRALHHYDAIGLLSPSMRSAGDYRLYSREDIERLYQIRLYSALGFPLKEMRRLLDDPAISFETALTEHRRRLEAEIQRFEVRLRTLDRLLENPEIMDAEELFDGFEREQWQEDAEQRWGSDPRFTESRARVASYDERTMTEIRQEADALLREFAEVKASGKPASDGAARDLAERYRQHLDRWFYPLSREDHVPLGEMYVADERFQKSFERVAPGLAAYVRDAIVANAAREA